MIDPVQDAREKAVDLMEKANAAKLAGNYAEYDDLYSASLVFIRILKLAGEDVEVVR